MDWQQFYTDNTLFINLFGFFSGAVSALITISETTRSVFFSIFSSKPVISGRWLLIIYTADNKIYKVDEYTIKQVKTRVSGKIKRLYSKEDPGQTNVRRYTFQGYYTNKELFFAFLPDDSAINSYGVCSLIMSRDFEYSGSYYVPASKQKTDKKELHIKLTKSADEIMSLRNFNIRNVSRKVLKHPVNKRLQEKIEEKLRKSV
ncbi:MAG: hypothetical protein ACT6QS_00390 [Flavobacteriales bacterium]